MKKTILHILAISMTGFGIAHAAPPLNDSILKASRLESNYTSFGAEHDISTGTAAPTDPLINNKSAGKSLWFAIPRPVMDGTLRIELKSSTAAGYATVYEVMDAENPAATLSRVGGFQNIAAGQTLFIYSGNPVRELRIMVSGNGKFQIRHRFSSAEAPNDFPADAEELTGDTGTVSGNTTMATLSSDEPVLPPQSPDVTNTLWYQWTPSFSGTAHLDTNFSYLSGSDKIASDGDSEGLHATVISVFRGPLSGPIFVTSDASSGFGPNSRATFTATAGTTYTIGVSTLAGKSTGAFILNYYRGNSGGEIFLTTGAGWDQYLTEQAKSVTALVRRRYAGDFASTCTVATGDNTAKAVLDYVALNQTVSFDNSHNDSQWQKEVNISVIDDAVSEPDEFFNITVSNPSANATIGSSSLVYCDILNDDSPPPSTLAGPAGAIRVRENHGTLQVPIRRVVDSKAHETLSQYLLSGTAALSGDFTLAQNTLLAAGASETSVGFTLVNDDVFEAEETATIRINGNAEYTVIIEDDDLYLPVPGRLTAGLAYGYSARQAVVFATVSNIGVVTGKLIAVGKTVPFSGKLDTRGKLVVPVAMPGRAVFMLSLAAQDSSGTFKVDLLDGETKQMTSKTTVIQRFAPVINPCPLAGAYTLHATGGFGVQCPTAATIKVDASGNAVMAGKLYDGTPYTASGYVDGGGYAGILASLYAGKGCVGLDGLLPFNINQAASPTLTVNRPSRSDDLTKAPPYVKATTATVCRYTPPAKGTYALATWSTGTGKASLSGLPLANTLVKDLTISTSNVITAPADAEKLKITLVPTTGIFTGSFVLPGTTKTVPLFGALSQYALSSFGKGWFFNGYYGGSITLTKP